MIARLSIFFALLLGAAAGARGEIAVMASGKILYIDGYHRQDERITLFITGGGEIDIPAELVANIVPNEIAPEAEQAAALSLLPHLDPLIQPVAERYGIDPRLVAAVIWVESSGDPAAVSRKGARGLMQLMPETARSLGVRNVLDPVENIAGGVRYLRELLDSHDQDVRLALAAYNAGPTAVMRHRGIPPYPETRKYVTRVLETYQRVAGVTTEAGL